LVSPCLGVSAVKKGLLHEAAGVFAGGSADG
jgi:hypothetical protein